MSRQWPRKTTRPPGIRKLFLELLSPAHAPTLPIPTGARQGRTSRPGPPTDAGGESRSATYLGPGQDKLARTVIYGRLEDEKPFSTVRRLVEYEDHLLRLMRDAGLPTPRPYGFAEITPEREYLIIMEFFAGGAELRRAGVNDAVIDDALLAVRRMWDAGLAHRDIKPSNVLVRDDRALLIDVAFAAVRPTPWRQAVDLANMMLSLALASSPEHVYERGLRLFAAEDVAEAFAASRSVTIPTQLRTLMRADGRDLIGRFRQLAPSRRPVPIQLWDLRRVGATLALMAFLAAALAVLIAYVRVAGLL